MKRISYLDGLRGWASLVVVAHHLLIAFYPALFWRTNESIHTGNAWELLIHGTPITLFINGGLAVAVFLIMSGYVLTMQFDKQGTASINLAYFGISRFVRFFLLMLTTNMLAYVAMTTGFADNLKAAALTQSWGWLGNQWLMAPSLIDALSQSIMGLLYMYPIGTVYNSSIWTMPLFFLGGFLVAIVFQITTHLKAKWLIYGLLFALLLKGNYYLLLIGMMLYELTHHTKPQRIHPLVTGLLLLIICYFGGYPYFYSTSHFSSWYAWLPIFNFTYTSTFYHGIAATALLILLINNSWLQRIFSFKLFTYFGARSFSLYLVHIVVILSVTSRLFITFIPRFPYSTAIGISFGLSLLLMWGLTELLYQLIEKRSSALAKHIYQRLALKVQ